MPDGTCITGAEEIDEDVDDIRTAPPFNTSIGFDEYGREIWYCSKDVTIVGMPCSDLLSPEERLDLERKQRPTPILNYTDYFDIPPSCPPGNICINNLKENEMTIIDQNNPSDNKTIILPDQISIVNDNKEREETTNSSNQTQTSAEEQQEISITKTEEKEESQSGIDEPFSNAEKERIFQQKPTLPDIEEEQQKPTEEQEQKAAPPLTADGQGQQEEPKAPIPEA